jgi:hypothetical protein
MEDQNGAPTDGVAAAPFSELISAWLDEGDRLDEKAAATAMVPAAPETPLRRLASRLHPALDRYRLFVLAGVGLIPFLLFTLTHHTAPAATVAMAIAVVAPSPPATVPSLPAVAPPMPAAAPINPPVAAESPVVGVKAAVRPAPHRHHHTLKRHVGCGPGRCPPAGSPSPAARAGIAAPARPGPRHVGSGPGR